MSNPADLKNALNTKTTNLVLLGIVTLWVFPTMWLYRNLKTIENIIKAKIVEDIYIIWIAICIGLSSIFTSLTVSFLNSGDYRGAIFSNGIGTLAAIACGVLWIVFAFKARKALQNYALHEHRIELKMNAFYTFAFTIFYVNYCINDLPEAVRRNAVVNSTPGNVQVVSQQLTGPGGATEVNPSEKLQRAKELLDKGLISEAEYEAMRARIIEQV